MSYSVPGTVLQKPSKFNYERQKKNSFISWSIHPCNDYSGEIPTEAKQMVPTLLYTQLIFF